MGGVSEGQKDNIVRLPNGRFAPGQSAHPSGRPPGTKNKITLLKQSLELELREGASGHMSQVLEKAIELALSGDRQMIKMLLELHMSKGSAVSDNKAKEKVEININSQQANDTTESKDNGKNVETD